MSIMEKLEEKHGEITRKAIAEHGSKKIYRAANERMVGYCKDWDAYGLPAVDSMAVPFYVQSVAYRGLSWGEKQSDYTRAKQELAGIIKR